ncbi:uncharacterized protein [Apostichopus japonicus]|uniref:uncharacterized protein n=1 Tax=Stichopus japonicus TaxID=307972 RepID=UPI003AB752BC
MSQYFILATLTFLVLKICSKTCGLYWDVYDDCENPTPSNCCPLYYTLVCSKLMLNSSDQFEKELSHKLAALVISNSNSTFIQTGDWRFLAGLSNLRELSFINNGKLLLDDINSTYFQNLTKLKSIYIYHNNIETLPTRIFQGMMSLENLYLSSNGIVDIGNVFQNLTSVESLNLSHNQLVVVKDDTLRGFSSLKTLNLSKNKISIFSLNILQYLQNLESLDLGYNELVFLTGTYVDHKSLKSLVLENNYLVNSNSAYFYGFTSLRSVSLSYNNISYLPINWFNNNSSSVVQLGLRNNFIEDISSPFFSYFPNVEEINLSRNLIKNITDLDLFNRNIKLSALSLEYNKIESINPNLFSNNPYLRFLDLAGNQIEFLDVDTLNNLYGYSTLNLLDNPINCDCYAIYLRDYLLMSNTHETLFPSCATPNEYNNQKISSVNFTRCETDYEKTTLTHIVSVTVSGGTTVVDHDINGRVLLFGLVVITLFLFPILLKLVRKVCASISEDAPT